MERAAVRQTGKRGKDADQVKIFLTDEEIKSVSSVASLRNSEAIRMRATDKKRSSESDYHIHRVGALGEYAWKKASGSSSRLSVNTFKSSSDLDGVEIRTRTRHYYDLIIRPDDNPVRIFVLVTTIWPTDNLFWIRGHIVAQNAMIQKFWKNYGGHGSAWFVPASDLIPIDRLLRNETAIDMHMIALRQ